MHFLHLGGGKLCGRRPLNSEMHLTTFMTIKDKITDASLGAIDVCH